MQIGRARDAEELKERANQVLQCAVNVAVNEMHVSRELYARQWSASASVATTTAG